MMGKYSTMILLSTKKEEGEEISKKGGLGPSV